jgi:hypothetical protein
MAQFSSSCEGVRLGATGGVLISSKKPGLCSVAPASCLVCHDDGKKDYEPSSDITFDKEFASDVLLRYSSRHELPRFFYSRR